MTTMQPSSARRVLITGGTGFIGSHLARDCVARGDHVTVLTRAPDKAWRLRDLRRQIDLVAADPHDPAETLRIVADVAPQRVFYLAAATRVEPRPDLGDIEAAIGSNVAPLRNVLDAVRRLPVPPEAVVRAGTYAEYGECAHIHDVFSPEQPVDAYGLSALVGTHMLRLARERGGLPAVTVRLSLVYGASQSSDFMIPWAIREALAGRPIRIRRPHARRDVLHIHDAVAAFQLVADCAATMPPVVAVSTGAPVAMGDLGDEIARLLGADRPRKSEAPAPDEARHTLSCRPSAAVLAAGWRPQVALRDGLAQVIACERESLLHLAERNAP